MHFSIARHAVDIPFVEIDQRPGFPQALLRGMQIVEILDREGIKIQMRQLRHAALLDMSGPVIVHRRAADHHDLLHNVLAELRAMSLFLKRAAGGFDD
jgi:hypothetical protein